MKMNENWQCKTTTLRQRGEFILKSSLGADIHFLLGPPDSEQRIVAAHKVFLIMASPVFECMFGGKFVERDKELIEIPDIKPDIFEKVLAYIYTERVLVDNVNDACEQYYAAEKYILTHLSKELLTYIKKHITGANACQVYEFATLYNYEVLMATCKEIISNQTQYVLNDASFLNIKTSTLVMIYRQDSLAINNELQLFDALVKYGTHNDLIPLQPFNTASSTSTALSASENSSNSAIDAHETATDSFRTYRTLESNAGGRSGGDGDDDGDDDDGDGEEMSFESQLRAAIMRSAASLSVPPAHRLLSTHPRPPTAITLPEVLPSTPSESLNRPISSSIVNISSVNDSITAIKKLDLLEALKSVRFLTMTTRQFSKGPARSGLLDCEQKLAIFINLCDPSDYPMPEGFSQSRVMRRCLDFTSADVPRRSREIARNLRSMPASLAVVTRHHNW